MLKKIYNFILPTIFCICFIFSFVLEEQRKVVLILSIISLIIALVMFITYCLNSDDKPIPLLLISLIMIFLGRGKYNFEIFTITESDVGYISIAIILVCSLYKTFRKYTDRKSFVEFFIIYTIFFLIFYAGCDRFINYGFDLSNEIETELVIEKQNDQGHSLSAEGYFGYIFIEYAVTSNDLGIETVDIIDGYKLKPGDKVKIVYRKGFHTPIYSTEYDPYWLFPG